MKLFSTVARILTICFLVVIAGSAAAQNAYPSKPIRFIVPSAPGGATSVLARIVGQRLTESWGQQVIIDSRPGGNTIIGSEALLKSLPDGYTCLMVYSGHAILPGLLSKLPYDTVKDFAPVATVGIGQYVLVLYPSVPANSVQELIALAKSRPGQLNSASSGSGSGGQLASEMFNILAGVRTQDIPYKGAGPAMIDLVGGQVQLSFTTAINVVSHIKNGKLKAIAVTGENRLSALPQVPTFTESGLQGMDINVWHGLVVPAGTPMGIIEKLSAEIGKILTIQDVKEKLVAQGFDPFISSPGQFAALLKADISKYAKIIKTANIKLE